MAGGRRSGIACLVAAGLIGVGAGPLAGGRALRTDDWRTEWFGPAPLPTAYDAMTSRRRNRAQPRAGGAGLWGHERGLRCVVRVGSVGGCGLSVLVAAQSAQQPGVSQCGW